MKLRWVYPILLLSSLLIAGCVRQAGQPFEPAAPSGIINTPLPPTDLPTQEPVDEAVTAEAQAAETEISITVIPPTETPLPLLETTNTPTTTTLPPTATSLPTQTSIATSIATIEAAGIVTEEAIENGSQSVVPSFPQPPDIITETPIPTATAAPAIGATPTDFANLDSLNDDDIEDGSSSTDSDDGCIYVVQRGDNAFRIAVNNNITLAELQRANPAIAGINPVIQPGQELEIPGCGDGTAVTRSTPEPTTTTAGDSETTTTTRATATITAPTGYFAYSIASGDTLFELAQEYGTTVTEIVRFNEIPNPDSLAIGDVIFLPLEDE